jgi:Fe-S oxidoreductase
VVKPVLKVALFAGCAQDFVYPEQLMAATRLLREKRVEAEFPLAQGCCGLPVQMMGERAAAERIAASNVEAFDRISSDKVLTLCASCAAHMSRRYGELTAGRPELAKKTEKFVSKIVDFSSLLKNFLKIGPEDFVGGKEKTAYHASCHLCRGLGVVEEPRALIAAAGEYVVTPEEDVCCGFGGSYSLKFPETAAAMMARKLEGVEASGARTLVADCPGCVMQLRGGELSRGGGIKVEHMAEFLARNLR